MKIISLIATGLALTAAAPAHNDNEIRAAVTAIMAPYSEPPTKTAEQVNFERPVFTVRTRALITRWQNRGGPKDIVTDLDDVDWFCQCQDWNYRITKLGDQKLTWLGPNHVESTALFTVFKKDQRRIRFVMAREDGKWLIDNLYFEGRRASLTTQLRAEIAAVKR